MSIRGSKREKIKIQKIITAQKKSEEVKIILEKVEAEDNLLKKAALISESFVVIFAQMKDRVNELDSIEAHYCRLIEDYLHTMQLGKGILSGSSMMKIMAVLINTRIKRSKVKSESCGLRAVLNLRNAVDSTTTLCHKIIGISKGFETSKYTPRSLTRDDLLNLLSDKDKLKIGKLEEVGLSFDLRDQQGVESHEDNIIHEEAKAV